MTIKYIPTGWFDYKKVQATVTSILLAIKFNSQQIMRLLNVIAENCNLNNLGSDILPTIKNGKYTALYKPRSEDDPDYGVGPILIILSTEPNLDYLQKVIKAKQIPVNCHRSQNQLIITFSIERHQKMEAAIMN